MARSIYNRIRTLDRKKEPLIRKLGMAARTGYMAQPQMLMKMMRLSKKQADLLGVHSTSFNKAAEARILGRRVSELSPKYLTPAEREYYGLDPRYPSVRDKDFG